MLTRLGKIISTLEIRKLEYFGGITRHPERYELSYMIIEGKIEGKQGPGRRRESWFKRVFQEII